MPRKHVHRHTTEKRIVPFDVRLLLVVGLLLGVVAVAEYSGLFSNEQFVEATVVDVNQNTIILGRDCKAIVADTTADQARSIRLGIEKKIEVRPTAHDIFVETLETFDITVEEAALTRYENDIYYAELVLRSGDKVLRLDSKPTDALAIALRTNTTMMINKSVLEEQGQNIC